MFHGKFLTIEEVQHVAKTQIITTNVNVVDLNVITRSKTIKELVFKDKKPRKAKECY